MTEFDEWSNQGTQNHEVYDTTDWSERRLIQFVNYNINKRTVILERYLLFICIILLLILFKIW